MNWPSELGSFARFLRGVPRLVTTRIGIAEAEGIVRERLAMRERNFVDGIARGIYGNVRSPYRALLAHAGCELSDVRHLVDEHGLEGALQALKDAGVYVTFEEFKGSRAIVRGSTTIETRPADFDNPAQREFFSVSTGGSTGAARRVLMDLAFLESRKPMHAIMVDAHGLAGAPMAQWAEIPPGHGLEAALIQTAQDGNLSRWFTPLWSGPTGPGLRFRAATQLTVWTARRCGVPMPFAEPLALDDADVIARWAGAMLAEHGRCSIRAHVSKALRIALAARELGIDLTGVVISGGGEPPTPAKVRHITASGARLIQNYFVMEAGPVGLGCPHADDPSDQHFMGDHLAMIDAPRHVGPFGATVNAFYVSTLLPSAPKVMLNVESDDCGIREERSCGCRFDSLGLRVHLRQIRSFSKLTGEGVTLLGSDIEHILEDELPRRFGGTPLDYQMVEEEDASGMTRLTLVMHPRLPAADESQVVATVHRLLAERGGAAGISRGLWEQAKTLRVRREPPRLNARGKLWPLHAQERRTDPRLGVHDDDPPSGSGQREGAA